MDVFAHTLWTNALFHLKYNQQRRKRYLAAFFGVVPDLIGFAPLFIYMIFSGRLFSGEQFPFAQTNWTFSFAENAYNYTHSLVIFAVVTALVTLVLYIRRGREISGVVFPWPMLGWGLHICIDFFTHPDFYHTPIVFPLSDFRFTGGISWGHPVFMAINYSLLILAYIAIYIYQKKKYASKE